MSPAAVPPALFLTGVILNFVANVESIFVYLPNGVKLDVSNVDYDVILSVTNPKVLKDSDRGYYQ